MSNLLNITASQLIVENAKTGKKYDFIGLNSVAIEDPRATHITRGADGLDKSGIEYSEGNTQPIVFTAVVRTTQNFYPLFQKFYTDKTRLNVSIVDTINARVVFVKEAIIQKLPVQTTIDETEDSVNVSFVFESFIFDADYKGGKDFK
ncbi:MAG: hypothetical protein LBH29_03120 [Elusimicrobiota bacterium]|jgi:hypothetical protein|nr:hypothetical protein [Elusimicrobiota bacterium]